MNAAELATCEFLPWDTEFFGCQLARVRGDTLTPERAGQIDDWSRNHGIQGLYFLARVDDPATIQTAEKHGFGLVDIRVTLALELKDSDAPVSFSPSSDFCIRAFQSGDLRSLQDMARTGHQGTRFFNDGHFSRQRVEDFYSTWITLETQGRAQMVFVAAQDQQPLGYVSCHLDSTRRKGQIGLIGVAAEARGRGLGRSLVCGALGWFRSQGASEASVVTQGRNLAAQRLYQKCDFLSGNLELWYHKWYSVPT